METIIILASLLWILVIPTLCFFVNGDLEDDGMHMFIFLFLGFLLFIPVAYVVIPAANELYAMGILPYPATENGCDFAVEACKTDAIILPYWLGTGVLVYMLDYTFGVAMHRLILE